MFYSAKKKGVIADLGTSEASAESVVFKDALAVRSPDEDSRWETESVKQKSKSNCG